MLDEFFGLEERNTNIRTEIIAGITTFLSMVYILGVNPTMLAEGGMPATSVFFATALASAIACIVMGLISNFPIGMAPGMGTNALLTFTIVLSMNNSWQAALAAVFISSIIFLLLTVSGLRKLILDAIPLDLKLAIGAGIGFFLAFIGLRESGIIVSDPSTFVAMGNIMYAPALLAVLGIFITLVLYIKRVPVSLFLGMIITSIIGIIFGLCGFGVGEAAIPTISSHIVSFSFDTTVFLEFLSGFGELFSDIPELIVILFSLLFVSFFDTSGTLISLTKECDLVDEEGNCEGIERGFLGVGLGGIIGAICGTSTIAAYVESATGISLGGRTGLTAIVTGIMFFLSILFAPLILSLFTPSVTASALVMVGILMIYQLKYIHWDDLVVASSSFITIIMMVLTFSISIGIAWGFVVYVAGCLASRNTENFTWVTWIMVIDFVLYIFFGL